MRIRHLYISSGHNYFGHRDQPPGEHPVLEVKTVECVAGRGLRGDRFFDYKPDYKGQITFFAAETHAALSRELGIFDKPPSVYRRNVITEGVDLNSLLDQEFEIQGIRFHGMGTCTPCYWMDAAFAPGAEVWLKNCGGLRAKILMNGILQADTP